MKAFLLLIVLSAVGVATYVPYLRWRTFGRRSAKPLRETYDQEDLLHTIAFNEFSEAMEGVAKCYSVAVEKLRLDDSFKKELGEVDSWRLGGGSENMVKFLTAKYPGLGFEGIVTIREMLIAIGKTTKQESGAGL